MRLPVLVILWFVPASASLADGPPVYPDKSRLLVVRDRDGKERPVRYAADWAERRRHIVQHMEAVMGPLPGKAKKVPLDAKVIEESDQGTYIRRKLTIAVEEGDRLPMYLLIPKKRADRTPAVICLHPTSRELGKGIPTGFGDKPDRHYAVHLVERGLITLAPDYVNMGEYRFDPYRHGYASATMKGIWNHMRCVDYLQSLTEVDGERIGAIGHSLGGHNAIFLGVFDERVRCIVSNCGFCSFPTYMKGDLTGWSHDGYMPRIRTHYDRRPDRMPWDFTETVAALAPRAFLASAPTRDSNFDRQGVEDCITAAAPVYRLLNAADRLRGIYPEGEHEFPDAARTTAYEWIDTWLRR